MFKKYAIEFIDTPEFEKRLKDVVLPYEGNLVPLERVLAAVQELPLNCQTVVFEYNYIDLDYQDEFSAFYSKAFKRYPSSCVRLHFFSAKIPQKTKVNFGKYKDSYLGFVVIRPTDLQRMGRTILRPTITDLDHQFIHCTATFRAHLLGEVFSVTGMPFTQQDTQVGACAQASIWMLARYMSARYNYREYLPAEINQYAKAKMAIGRHFPAEEGLNNFQMLDALQAMGFSSLLYSISSMDDCATHVEAAFKVDCDASESEKVTQRKRQRSAKLADTAYRYIESGLPVIFATCNHAVVGIGHSYDSKIKASVAIERIPSFFINNDNDGPYRECLINPNIENKALCFDEVESIMAVVPREVTLKGEEAEIMASACIDQFLQLEIAGQKLKDVILQKLRPDLKHALDNLEYRTFLVPSVEFQKSIRSDMKMNNFNWRLGAILLRLDYPKFIWVTEVSSSDYLNMNRKKDRRCVGRVVTDATAPAKTQGAMIIHIADCANVYDRQTGHDNGWKVFPRSTPFQHKIH